MTLTASRLPPTVHPGDRVGVAALSGRVDPEALDAGLEVLARLGFEPVEAANLRRQHGIFAGDDEERLEGFHRLAADPGIRAILFARGGHGVLRLLPGIDWELLGRVPRAYVGYSDLTPFLLEVERRFGLVSFHGPMVAADLARGLDSTEEESFLDALAGRWPSVVRSDAVSAGAAVRAPLRGGCLSLLVSTLGTQWAPRLEGSLVLLEELDEPLYRFDRMLTHLRLSGTLNEIRGLVVGHLIRVGSDLREEVHEAPAPESLAVLQQLADEGRYPLLTGVSAGHRAPNLTLPLGAPAVLDPAAGTLTFEAP